MAAPTLAWFRNDLRLEDNPMLAAAKAAGDGEVIPVYVLDEVSEGVRPLGGASKWWLDKTLRALGASIEKRGGTLVLRKGAATDVIPKLANETGAKSVVWGTRYDEAGREADAAVSAALEADGVSTESVNTTLLTEPGTIQTDSGSRYKVFSPFWRKMRELYGAPEAALAPDAFAGSGVQSDRLDDWGLHPTDPDWSTGFDPVWTPGEAGAAARLDAFLEEAVSHYDARRNRPDIEGGTTGLSPHLRFGEISPALIWRRVEERLDDVDEAGAWTFLSELAWRDFSYVTLFHEPELAKRALNPDFDHMPWLEDETSFGAWTRGHTGYPIVDAGMRQLWETGWIHNRVRMITASFLTKHLLLPWQDGEAWFWDCLVDADPASNPASWQWVAGSGIDASPYFRIFNPITQGEKFDETRAYVRRWVPEIAKLPDRVIYQPWEARPEQLTKAGIKLGTTYPKPIVVHKDARKRALAAYDEVKAAKAKSAKTG